MENNEIDPWTTIAGFVALAVLLILECIALYNSLHGGAPGWPNPAHWLDGMMRFRS